MTADVPAAALALAQVDSALANRPTSSTSSAFFAVGNPGGSDDEGRKKSGWRQGLDGWAVKPLIRGAG